MELIRKLKQRHAKGRPVAVGLVGCGQMGSGLAYAINVSVRRTQGEVGMDGQAGDQTGRAWVAV